MRSETRQDTRREAADARPNIASHVPPDPPRENEGCEGGALLDLRRGDSRPGRALTGLPLSASLSAAGSSCWSRPSPRKGHPCAEATGARVARPRPPASRVPNCVSTTRGRRVSARRHLNERPFSRPDARTGPRASARTTSSLPVLPKERRLAASDAAAAGSPPERGGHAPQPRLRKLPEEPAFGREKRFTVPTCGRTPP